MCEKENFSHVIRKLLQNLTFYFNPQQQVTLRRNNVTVQLVSVGVLTQKLVKKFPEQRREEVSSVVSPQRIFVFILHLYTLPFWQNAPSVNSDYQLLIFSMNFCEHTEWKNRNTEFSKRLLKTFHFSISGKKKPHKKPTGELHFEDLAKISTSV